MPSFVGLKWFETRIDGSHHAQFIVTEDVAELLLEQTEQYFSIKH